MFEQVRSLLSSAKSQLFFIFGLIPLLAVIAPVQAADPAVPVTVEAVKETTFASLVKEVGKINAINSAGLTFNASEKIIAINFNNGDEVKKGDVIAKINNIKAQTDLDKAKSSLALAKTNLERIESLLAKEPYALSKQDIDKTKESVNLALADYQQKKASMKDYLITAPFNGRLTSFNQSIGSQISAGTVLVTLYNLNPVEVTYAISQSDLGKAAKGQKVRVTVDAYSDKVFEGHVNYVAPAVDESSGRVEVHAVLDNPDYKLAPGMFANVKQYFDHGLKHLLVPQNSVIANNDERYVWLVKGNKVVKQVVTLEHNTNEGDVVITSGLKVGDIVVKTGMQNLNEASTVTILEDKTSQPQVEKIQQEGQ